MGNSWHSLVESFSGLDGTRRFFLCWPYATSYLFLFFLCPTLGIPSFLSASCFQFFILVYLLPSKLVCFWRTRLFDSNLWLLVFRPLEQYLAFAGPMWIVHYMRWSFSFNLTFFFDNFNWCFMVNTGFRASLKKPVVPSHIFCHKFNSLFFLVLHLPRRSLCVIVLAVVILFAK